MTKKRKNTQISFLLILGILFLFLGVVILFFTFYPVVREELNYQFNKPVTSLRVSLEKVEQKQGIIVPVDFDFGIIIPKISANAKVVKDVDPLNPDNYQKALTKGIAHAKGTAYPGEKANTFLFAHSANNWYQANRYNAIFYLIHKLQKGDLIYLTYKNKLFTYLVSDLKYVEPDQTQYFSLGNKEQLTLMTCWPPGTTLKRLVVTARPK